MRDPYRKRLERKTSDKTTGHISDITVAGMSQTTGKKSEHWYIKKKVKNKREELKKYPIAAGHADGHAVKMLVSNEKIFPL